MGEVMASCSQCDTPGFVQYGEVPLCIDHHLKLKQAEWYDFSKLAAWHNKLADDLAQSTGYVLGLPKYINIPPPPNVGGNLVLNNINITGSAIGMLNTGTIKNVGNIDASVTNFRVSGNEELADALRNFTQILVDTVDEPERNNISEHLAYLAAQAQAEPQQRSAALCKTILNAIGASAKTIPLLSQSWQTLRHYSRNFYSSATLTRR